MCHRVNESALPHAGCDVGIVFAVPIEADAFERLSTDRVEIQAGTGRFHEGNVAGRRVAWCVAGIGAAAAAAATRLLVEGHRPRLLITAGFAGGLDPALFDGLMVHRTAGGAAALADAAAWMECRPVARVAHGDHVVVLAEVVSGAGTDSPQPLVHVRKNGLRY